MELITDEDDPYIIAIASQLENQLKFYIEVKKKLLCVSTFTITFLNYLTKFQMIDFHLQVPVGKTFLDVLNLFYKVHKVFNLKFNKNFSAVMNFIDFYIFDVKETQRFIPEKHQEIASQIFTTIPAA